MRIASVCRVSLRAGLSLSMGLTFGSCGAEKPPVPPPVSACTSAQLPVVTGSTGVASVFYPDPLSSSGNINLTPNSTHLDDFRTLVSLERLSGKGILEGKYASIVNHLDCDDLFNAFDIKNNFTYSHADHKFSEAMLYYFADSFRNTIDSWGYLGGQSSLKLISHCEQEDNAYYYRNVVGGSIQAEGVCLGDSVTSPGAYYSDDAEVAIHEIQHGVTGVNYSPAVEVGDLGDRYEEAGALNEAISDFMSAMVVDSQFTPASAAIDPRIFSRWALGTFHLPSQGFRGAHRCPGYDSHYPECAAFPKFENSEGQGSDTISYIYPDGLGWPYWNNYTQNGAPVQRPVDVIFQNFSNQEEIHSNSVLLFGALWDVYASVKALHGGDVKAAAKAVGQLVLEAVRHLPLPNHSTNRSPVHFIALAEQVMANRQGIAFLTDADRAAIETALTHRGLYGFAPLLSDWMSPGPGTSFLQTKNPTPGLFIKDDAQSLKSWLTAMGADPSIVTQPLTSSLNRQPDPGEVFAAWFDLKNNAPQTAGGVLVTVSALDPGIEVLDASVNPGYLTQASVPTAQVMYSKINGTEILRTLKLYGAGNTYFTTNPQFNQNYRTALWFKVSTTAQHQQVVRIRVKAKPANGAESVADFSVLIH